MITYRTLAEKNHKKLHDERSYLAKGNKEITYYRKVKGAERRKGIQKEENIPIARLRNLCIQYPSEGEKETDRG